MITTIGKSQWEINNFYQQYSLETHYSLLVLFVDTVKGCMMELLSYWQEMKKNITLMMTRKNLNYRDAKGKILSHSNLCEMYPEEIITWGCLQVYHDLRQQFIQFFPQTWLESNRPLSLVCLEWLPIPGLMGILSFTYIHTYIHTPIIHTYTHTYKYIHIFYLCSKFTV